jgi:hypothetical protein
VYGLVAFYLQKSVSWGTTWVYYAAFIAFMLVCSIAKERVVDWWSGSLRALKISAIEE